MCTQKKEDIVQRLEREEMIKHKKVRGPGPS